MIWREGEKRRPGDLDVDYKKEIEGKEGKECSGC